MELVVAKTLSGVIGNKGSLPWYIPDDLRHFKQLTLGGSVLMGRKTWDEIYARLGKALPQRRNIVLTSRPLPSGVDAIAVAHLEEGVAAVGENGIVIGGAQLYRATMPKMKVLHITEVLGDYQGDTFFPEINEDEWTRSVEKETPAYRFITLTRKCP